MLPRRKPRLSVETQTYYKNEKRYTMKTPIKTKLERYAAIRLTKFSKRKTLLGRNKVIS